jgi:hypothetical protein
LLWRISIPLHLNFYHSLVRLVCLIYPFADCVIFLFLIVGAFCFGFADAIEQTQLFSIFSTLFTDRVAIAMAFKIGITAASSGLMFLIQAYVSFEAQSILVAVFAVLGVLTPFFVGGDENTIVLGSIDDCEMCSTRE